MSLEVKLFEKLDESSPEYVEIKTRVERAKTVHLKVQTILKLNNPTVMRRYMEKKILKEMQYPNLKEIKLFHDTEWKNVESICKNNLSKDHCDNHEYGVGVYFTESSAYAAKTKIGVQPTSGVRCMFLCKVLIGNAYFIIEPSTERNTLTNHPPGFDATCKSFAPHFVYGIVCKCDDDEYYPEYLINYVVV